MGGFTSTAPLFAGRLAGVPTFVHESNAIPGKANRFNARLSRVVLLGFEECAKHFPPATRCLVTGTPIRTALRERLAADAARKVFGLEASSDKKTLLVMGGSQGAHGINQAVLRAAPEWRTSLQIIHFTGKDDEQSVRASYERDGITAYVAAFHHRMQEAYSAADFAHCAVGRGQPVRAGLLRPAEPVDPLPVGRRGSSDAERQDFHPRGRGRFIKGKRSDRRLSGQDRPGNHERAVEACQHGDRSPSTRS